VIFWTISYASDSFMNFKATASITRSIRIPLIGAMWPSAFSCFKSMA
jgi:hypothetical protein